MNLLWVEPHFLVIITAPDVVQQNGMFTTPSLVKEIKKVPQKGDG
jgi:hypothetical protein